MAKMQIETIPVTTRADLYAAEKRRNQTKPLQGKSEHTENYPSSEMQELAQRTTLSRHSLNQIDK